MESIQEQFLPNGDKRTIKWKDGYYSNREVKYNPGTLQRKAGNILNLNLYNYKDIDKLELPHVLKEDLKKHFLSDKIYHPWIKIKDYNWFNFWRPFINVGVDGRLILQHWKDVPYFVGERNLVYRYWYRLFDGRETAENNEWILKYYTDGLCKDCAYNKFNNNINIRTIQRCMDSEVVWGHDFVDEVLQVENYWCSCCKTTTLYYVDDFNESDYWRIYPFEQILETIRK